MMTDPNRVQDLFLQLVDLPPSDHSLRLEEVCREDKELLERVSALLKAHWCPDSLLDEQTAIPLVEWVPASIDGERENAGLDFDIANRKRFASAKTRHVPDLVPGSCISERYSLKEKLGTGGMGEVWVADQTEPVQRQVAIKLIRSDRDSASVLARFEQERQVLAVMDHPQIARVFDAGLTGSGQPFFVMELVEGLPLTQFCDESKLTLKQRLELFVPICHAVQHAHQKGIVHRDLKPANILITRIDGQPVPKVIDFGVAKAIGGKLAEATLSTQVGAVVGTLEYMSPEQANFQRQDIDTRTDIYSLGVILYELLTGLRPLDRNQLNEADFPRLMQMLHEEEPTKPSTRLSACETLLALATLRQTEPRKLTAMLRGELDWVVMKCLEKNRERRYASVNALWRDIERYLADEPVEARPPSAGYRVQKFLLRNRSLVGTALVIVLSLLIGTAAATWQAVRASEAEQAESQQRQVAEENEQRARQAADDERKARISAETERLQAEKAVERETAAKEAAQKARERALAAEQAMALALDRERMISYVHRITLAQREWQDNNLRRAEQLLEDCPPALRNWEWNYLHQLCHAELLRFTEHSSSVVDFALQPGGPLVASISQFEALVWNAETGKVAFKHTGLLGGGIAFSPDGKQVAIAFRETVTLHNSADGRELAKLTSDNRYFQSVAFSPDGKHLATGLDGGRQGTAWLSGGEARIWDLKTQKELQRMTDLPSTVIKVIFRPDGKSLAGLTASRGGEDPWPGQVWIWDTNTGKKIQSFQPYHLDKIHPGREVFFLRDLSLHPEGQLLATAGSDGLIRIWDAETGKETRQFLAHRDGVMGVAFHRDGKRLVSGGADQVLRTWDVKTGTELSIVRGHTESIRSLAFDGKGQRLATCAGKEIRIWDAATDQQAVTFSGDPGKPVISSIAISPDGKRLASGSISEVKIYDWKNGTQLEHKVPIKPGGLGGLTRIAFGPASKTIATTGSRGVRIWEVETGKEIRLFPDHPEIAQWPYTLTVGVVFHPDGKHIATVGRNLLTVWEVATGKIIHKIVYHREKLVLGAVAYSPDGKRLATAVRGSVRIPPEIKIWDAETGKELLKIQGGGSELKFSPDGTRLASNGDGEVAVWDTRDGTLLFKLKGHTRAVGCLEFSPDGKRLATGSDQTIKLWEMTYGREVFSLRADQGSIVGLAFSSDGKLLVSAGSRKAHQVKLWSASPLQIGPLVPEKPPAQSSPTKPAEADFRGNFPARLPSAKVPKPKEFPVISPENVNQIRVVSETEKIVNYIKAGPDPGELILMGKSFEVVEDQTFSKTRRPDPRFLPSEFVASEDGRFVAWSRPKDKRVVIQNLKEDTTREIEAGYNNSKLGFSPDGRLLVAGGYGTQANVFETQTGRVVQTLESSTRGSIRPVFRPDGKQLALGNRNGETLLFDTQTWKLQHTLRRSMTHGIAYSPNGKWLAAGYVDGTVAVWDTTSGELIHARETGAREIYAVDWSPKGNLLVTSGRSGNIAFWNPNTMEKITERTSTDWVHQILFLSNGTRLLSKGGTLANRLQDRKLTIWAIPEKK